MLQTVMKKKKKRNEIVLHLECVRVILVKNGMEDAVSVTGHCGHMDISEE